MDYYPYGMLMPGRFGFASDGAYRYGFNGMEQDPEANAQWGQTYTTYFRQYDPRLGRWFSVDPIEIPRQSPYNAFDSNPIVLNDPLGNCTDCDDDSNGGGNNGGDTGPDTGGDAGSDGGTSKQPQQEVTLPEFRVYGDAPNPDNQSNSTPQVSGDYGTSEIGQRDFGGDYIQWKAHMGLPQNVSRQYAEWIGKIEHQNWNLLHGLEKDAPYDESFDYWYNENYGSYEARRQFGVLFVAYQGLREPALIYIEGSMYIGGGALGVMVLTKGLGRLAMNARPLFVKSPSTSVAKNSSLTGSIYEGFVESYSLAGRGMVRAPKGGVRVNGKFYKGGQFLPRPRISFGRGSVPQYNSLPALSSPLRPTPMNFNAPASLRWGLGIGGSMLGGLYYYNKLIEK